MSIRTMKRVLIVDDVALNSQLLSFELMDCGFEVDCAISGEAALEWVENKKVDIILLDIQMPGIGGIETLKRLKANSNSKSIPVVMVTSMECEESLESCLELGAHDYLCKPVKMRELRARMQSALSFVNALEDLKKAKSELEVKNTELNRLATTDPLTECANRRHFFHLASAEFSRSKRYQSTFSVLMVDIDHFKRVNDTYGHAIGDKAIRALADLCLKLVRTTDIVGRIGGEEFAVCCPGVGADGALVLAERIRGACEDMGVLCENFTLELTVSIGIAEFSEADSGFDKVLERADLLLFQAKDKGRNNCQALLSEAKKC